METRKINLIFGSNIKHVLVCDGLLNKSVLKEYYPTGATLTYKKNSEIFLLNTDDNNIFIVPDVDDYYIDIRSPVEEVGLGCSTNADLIKRRKVNDYLMKIQQEGRKTTDNETKSTLQKITKINNLREAKSKFCSTPQFQSKSIYIGWKHRFNTNTKYKHQKGLVGGSKEFVLDTNIAYSVEDILQMGIKAFTHPVAVIKLKTSECKLGLFNEALIEKFVLPDDTPCGIWDFFKTNLPKFSRINLYILSTRNVGSDDDIESEDEMFDSIGSDDKSPKRALPNVAKKFVTAVKEFKSVDRSPYTKQLEINSEDSLSDVKSVMANQTKHDTNTKHDDESSFQQLVEAVTPTIHNIEKVPDSSGLDILADTASSVVNVTPVSLHSLSEEETAVKIIEHNYNMINILYLNLTKSKYSDELCIRENDSTNLYYSITCDENINVDENNFDPIDHGFPISTIFLNDKQVFQLIMDEFLVSTYLYPEIADCADKNHTIIYDIDQLIGYSNNKFGVGVLPKCVQSCHPVISWYEDDNLVKKGEMLIWMENISRGHKWHCEVECSTGIKMISKNIKISNNQEIYFHYHTIDILEVNKNEISLKEIIGKGQQGVVYRGRFNNEDVAVKVIKIFSKKIDRIETEIKALKSVNHDNFIKLFGVCKEVKKISLITNYFQSEKLSEFIFDDELKEKFGGLNNSSKNFIALQICRAITYLHNRVKPIVHCDIKPDNILINEAKLIKICDFGLSKFNTEVTILNSNTVGTGAGIVGTLSYVAPEILINRASANTKSDIWSTACTLVELFNEDLIWDVEAEDLKEKLRRQELPNLCNIPDLIKHLLEECFSYNPKKRPDIVNLYNVLNN